MSSDVFITEDFLLESETARLLYHDYVRDMPIIDYHCHLPPEQIAEDHRFKNLTEIWLNGDHYKWRAMRARGVGERLCTGDASDREKFQAWAETVPKVLRNPLYHWTHLELKRPFGICDRLLNPDTAQGIWDECNEKLASDDFSCRGIMKQMNVQLVCTTDDPIDSLEHHKSIAEDDSFDIKVLPTWRSDKAMAIENLETFNSWVEKLAKAADVEISDYMSFMASLKSRHDYFHSMGCRLADHGIPTFYAEDYQESDIVEIFNRVCKGQVVGESDVRKFKSAMLYELAVMNHEAGWVQQYHFGVIRNNNSRMFDALGPDTGFDSVGDFEVAQPMVKFFDRLDSYGQLTKTILYNINSRDNDVVASMLGNFQDGFVRGKMQMGSGWWFQDHMDGMLKQMEVLSNMGVLGCFIGMLTDSRSFLSYTRHEYFRRILCNLFGGEMERGLIPNDLELTGAMLKDICYNNVKNYFDFGL